MTTVDGAAAAKTASEPQTGMHPVMTGSATSFVHLEVHVEHAGKMLHRVTVRNNDFLEGRLRARHEPGVEIDRLEEEVRKVREREIVFYSDEPAFLGGDDEHPAPLEYFAAGIGT